MAALIPPVVLKATQRHTATLFFLHGLGDNGMGWAGALNTVRPPYMKVVCPTAPIIPITINMGAKMPAWFDVYTLDRKSKRGADLEGLEESSRNLRGMVEMETKEHGIPRLEDLFVVVGHGWRRRPLSQRFSRCRNRIIIGGFSQGGTVALHLLLSDREPFAGCLALSSFMRRQGMPEATADAEEKAGRKLTTPVLQCHGTWDEMVAIKWGRETRDLLRTRVADVWYHEMEGMGHEANMDELELVKDFLVRRTPPKDEAASS